MGSAGAGITRSVSQMSGHTSVPLTDDLLNTKRMTIEDLIESDKASNICLMLITYVYFMLYRQRITNTM